MKTVITALRVFNERDVQKSMLIQRKINSKGLKRNFASEMPSDIQFCLLGIILENTHRQTSTMRSEAPGGLRLTPKHISRLLRNRLEFNAVVHDGTLYTTLARMKSYGWIDRDQSIYKITEKGQSVFKKAWDYHQRLAKLGEEFHKNFLVELRRLGYKEVE